MTALLALLLCVAPAEAPASELDVLLDAIMWVESRGDVNAVGDGGRSVGPYQITKEYWFDGIETLGVRWGLHERRNPDRSRVVVVAYFARYGTHYRRATGKPLTLEVLARLHNSGPWTGSWPKATNEYWRKVSARMRRSE